MARGLNKVTLLGNAGKDPEVRVTPGGTAVASFSLATADRSKNQAGEWEDKTEWHNIVCFQRTAEIVRDYVKKGSQVLIEGKIQTRSWDDSASGEKKYKTEILVNELILLGGPDGQQSADKPQSRSTTPTTRAATPPQTRAVSTPTPRAPSPVVDDFLGDDIPF